MCVCDDPESRTLHARPVPRATLPSHSLYSAVNLPQEATALAQSFQASVPLEE